MHPRCFARLLATAVPNYEFFELSAVCPEADSSGWDEGREGLA